MLDDKEILQEMICCSARLGLESTEKNRYFIELREKQETNSTVIILGVPEDSVVIKVDEFPQPQSIFQGKKGECRRADYAIISAEKQCIIYIEMKKTKSGEKKIIQQLRGAKCVLCYCREIGKEFWEKKDFLDKYKERFVSMARTNGTNRRWPQKEKNAPEKKHDSPENLLKIRHSKRIEFNQLASLS